MSAVLAELTRMLDARRHGDPETSYVARLHRQGLNKILEKLGEECTETLLAAKDAERDGNIGPLIAETADLWFHSLVMLSHLGENANAVLVELARRLGTSGLDEKASRNQ